MLHRHLTKHLAKVAKTELDFSKDSGETDDIVLSLHLDTYREPKESKKSYVLLSVGNTGAGKTYTTVHEFLLKDKNRDKRRYFFFSAVPEDESLKAIVDWANKNPMNQRWFRVNLDEEDEDREDEEFEPPKLELNDYEAGDVLIFDDTVSLPRSNPYREDVLNLMVNGCQRARHNEIQIVATSHHLRANRLTKNLRQAAKWLLLFPRGNTRAFQHQILEDMLAFPRTPAKELTQRIARLSRWCFLHQHNPKFLLCSKALILL